MAPAVDFTDVSAAAVARGWRIARLEADGERVVAWDDERDWCAVLAAARIPPLDAAAEDSAADLRTAIAHAAGR